MRYSHVTQHNSQPGYWVTADRRKLFIRDMDTSHINNCIKMLERNRTVDHMNRLYGMFAGPQPQGDGNQLALDYEMGRIQFEPSPLPDVYNELMSEYQARNSILPTAIARVLHF